MTTKRIDIYKYLKIEPNDKHIFVPISNKNLDKNIDFIYNVIKQNNDNITKISKDNMTMYLNDDLIKSTFPNNFNKIITSSSEVFDKYYKYYGNVYNLTKLFELDNNVRYGMQGNLGLILNENKEYDKDIADNNLVKMLNKRRDGLIKCSNDNPQVRFYSETLAKEDKIPISENSIDHKCLNTIWGQSNYTHKYDDEIYIPPITHINAPELISIQNKLDNTIFIDDDDLDILNKYKYANPSLKNSINNIIDLRFQKRELMLDTIKDGLKLSDPGLSQQEKNNLFYDK